MLSPEPQPWDAVVQEMLSPQITRRAVHGVNSTVARFNLKKGAVVSRHRHISEQVSMVLEGALRLEFDDRAIVVLPGHLVVIPPDLPHSASALEETTVLDVFTPRREDWIRGDDSYLRAGGSEPR